MSKAFLEAPVADITQRFLVEPLQLLEDEAVAAM